MPLNLILLFINIQCLEQPVEIQELCVERVTACYERQIEIENETPIETARLCYGDFRERMK